MSPFISFYFYTFILCYTLSEARNFETMLYTDINQCKENQYFHKVLLSCEPCPVNQTISKLNHGYNCECEEGFQIIHENNGFNCKECPPEHILSDDKKHCVACKDNLTSDNSTICDDCPGYVTTQTLNGSYTDILTCIECSSEAIFNTETKSCEPCHESFYLASNSCICPNTHIVLGGICISRSELASIPDRTSSYIVEFSNKKEIESLLFVEYYRSVAHSCAYSKNLTACEALGNLCVLLHYSIDNELNACGYYRATFGEDFYSLGDHIPWLYYPEKQAYAYIYKSTLETHYSFEKKNVNSKLNLTVSKYSVFGELISYDKLENNLEICPDINMYISNGIKFGVKFSKSCDIPIKKLWDNNLYFYDIYIQYYDGNEHKIHAVPILNKNYKVDGSHLNTQSIRKWQLTRRFFIFDNISGKEASLNDINDKKERATVIRYAKNINLIIHLQNQESNGLIYIPYFEIQYEELNIEDLYYDQEQMKKITFRVSYNNKQDKMTKNISITMGVMCSVVTVLAVIETWSWSRRGGRIGIDMGTIIQLLILECGYLANVCFIVTFCMSFYWMIFFKRQDVVHTFLPTEDQEYIIKQYLMSGFFLKLIDVVNIIVVQVTLDFFIIDWEQPRARNTLPHPQLSSLSHDAGNSKTDQPISIWRTYFIANEWNEIQTMRKVNVNFQLFVVLFFLKFIGFEHLASADPYSNFYPPKDNYETVPQSYICRFAISIAIFGLIISLQWIFRAIIHERYIENKLQQFVDLCSMANISVFILEHTLYGYYIHGRSVHGYADADMGSFYEQLKREEEDLCGHRGLEPSSECQTFEVGITQRFREQYDNILRPVSHFAGIQRNGSRGKLSGSDIEKSVKAHETMKRFFAMFLQHALKDLDYIVKEKLFLENMLEIEFQEPSDKCTFFRDRNYAFTKTLLYGRETTFIVFEMLLFTFVDLLTYDFIIASIVTFLVAHLIKIIRNFGGKRNVIQKTLVDQRFLI